MIRRLRRFLRNLIVQYIQTLIPQAWRYFLIRQLIHIDQTPPEWLLLKIADTRDELEQAYQLVHDEYVKRGYMKPHSSGMRITILNALPTTTTVVAKRGGQVIATLTFNRMSPLGLQMQKAYTIDSILKSSKNIAEITSLAIHKDYQGKGAGVIFFPLLKYLYLYCSEYFALEKVLITYHPSMDDFYRAILLLEPIADPHVESCPFANGKPSRAAMLDFSKTRPTYAAHYYLKKPSKNLYQYFDSDINKNHFVFPKRKFHQVIDPVMTPEMLDYFFNQKTKIFSQLSPHEKLILLSYYPQSPYLKFLPKLNFSDLTQIEERRKETRFDAHIYGSLKIKNDLHQIKIEDVSRRGFKAKSTHPLRLEESFEIKIKLDEFSVAHLTVKPVKKYQFGTYGFQILKFDEEWEEFITNHEEMRLFGTEQKPKKAA